MADKNMLIYFDKLTSELIEDRKDPFKRDLYETIRSLENIVLFLYAEYRNQEKG